MLTLKLNFGMIYLKGKVKGKKKNMLKKKDCPQSSQKQFIALLSVGQYLKKSCLKL